MIRTTPWRRAFRDAPARDAIAEQGRRVVASLAPHFPDRVIFAFPEGPLGLDASDALEMTPAPFNYPLVDDGKAGGFVSIPTLWVYRGTWCRRCRIGRRSSTTKLVCDNDDYQPVWSSNEAAEHADWGRRLAQRVRYELDATERGHVSLTFGPRGATRNSPFRTYLRPDNEPLMLMRSTNCTTGLAIVLAASSLPLLLSPRHCDPAGPMQYGGLQVHRGHAGQRALEADTIQPNWVCPWHFVRAAPGTPPMALPDCAAEGQDLAEGSSEHALLISFRHQPWQALADEVMAGRYRSFESSALISTGMVTASTSSQHGTVRVTAWE